MAASLYDVSVKTYQQLLPAMVGLIDKAEAHAREAGLNEDAVLGAKLANDMWPFAKQMMQVVAHSEGAMKGLAAGEFSPDMTSAPRGFAALRERVQQALDLVAALDPAKVNALEDGNMTFVFGEHRMPFTPTDYILSFALPNFYFHATAAYAILRNLGVPVGKMDFLGPLRMKG